MQVCFSDSYRIYFFIRQRKDNSNKTVTEQSHNLNKSKQQGSQTTKAQTFSQMSANKCYYLSNLYAIFLQLALSIFAGKFGDYTPFQWHQAMVVPFQEPKQ